MELSTEYEERFFNLINKWPQTFYKKGLNEDVLVKYREKELQDMSQDLFSELSDLKKEVLRNATYLLQTGANERAVYLQALLNRTENGNIEIANSMDIHGLAHSSFALELLQAKPLTQYGDLEGGITQKAEFLKESKNSMKELGEFIRAELDGKPYRKYLYEPRNPTQKGNTKNTFKDLFKVSADYDTAIKALLDVKPPVINDIGDYCLGKASKSSIVAWLEILKKRGKLQPCADTELARLLNNQFSNLNFSKDGKAFRDTIQRKAYTKYYHQFENLIK